jgi:alkylation response protein AidB-like acyl-CoA dehydrogenase
MRTSATRDGGDYIVNGQKTFITHGHTADLICLAVKTDTTEGNGVRGFSLLVIETETTAGFRRGRRLDKVGLKAQDTAELFFEECRVPVSNIIGEAGRGFGCAIANLPRERLSIAVAAVASARHALALGLDHVRQRNAFGGPLAQLQSVRMQIAEMHTDIEVLSEYVDRCVVALNDGELTAAEAAGAKYKATDLQWEVLDRVLQMFGGYGYMEEYPIARMWRDARIQRIYGGSNEVMKDLVGRAVVG